MQTPLDRPFLLSLISYLLILSAIAQAIFVGIEFVRSNTIAVFIFGAILVNLIFNVVSAIAMLKGEKWGRTLCLILYVLSFTMLVLTNQSGETIAKEGVKSLIVLILLYRSSVTDYFTLNAMIKKNAIQKSQ